MSRLAILILLAVLSLGACAESKEAPLPDCTKGEVKCDPTGTRELLCKATPDGRTVYEAKACPAGTKCDPATGRCPDLCGECNTPPSDCYQREGTCWNGECQYDFADGQPCDDSDACTVNDTCQGGTCRPGQPKECTFVPADECVDSTKLKAYSTAGTCEQGDCTYAAATVDCPLGCDNGKCKGDPCLNVVCDAPPSSCHKAAGVCNAGTCTYLPEDSKACDDKDACTESDACSAGKCTGKPKVCDTPPKDSCKDADTLITYAATGTCKAGTCSYQQSEVACGHGCDTAAAACKGDLCDGVTCDQPPNVCYKMQGACSEGQCSYDPDNGKICDDNNACTTGDACGGGVCKGSAVVCNTPPKNTCKDDDTLVVFTAPGVCNAQGTCDYAKAEILCPSGCDAASGGCLGDPCAQVTCEEPPNDQCYSVPGICSGGKCIYLPKSGVNCDDADPCSKDDLCKSDGSCAGTAYTCSDSLVCTDNACDGSGGCSFPLKADSCLIKLGTTMNCFQKDELNAANFCQACRPATSQQSWGVSTGTEINKWSFDGGTLDSWTVTVNPDKPTTPVKWQLDGQRVASGTKSVYFGDVATHTYQDLGARVRGRLTSPLVTLPAAASAGKLCFEFKMYKDAEAYAAYDALTLSVIDASVTTQVWTSSADANYGNTKDLGAFVSFSVDISSAAGKPVQLEFSFDSIDSLLNSREGVYLDDIRVLKNCN